MIHEITAQVGAHKRRRRVGRGIAAGQVAIFSCVVVRPRAQDRGNLKSQRVHQLAHVARFVFLQIPWKIRTVESRRLGSFQDLRRIVQQIITGPIERRA